MRIENGQLIFTNGEIKRAEKDLEDSNGQVDRKEEAARFAKTINAYNNRTKGKFTETIQNWLYGLGFDDNSLQDAGLDGFIRQSAEEVSVQDRFKNYSDEDLDTYKRVLEFFGNIDNSIQREQQLLNDYETYRQNFEGILEKFNGLKEEGPTDAPDTREMKQQGIREVTGQIEKYNQEIQQTRAKIEDMEKKKQEAREKFESFGYDLDNVTIEDIENAKSARTAQKTEEVATETTEEITEVAEEPVTTPQSEQTDESSAETAPGEPEAALAGAVSEGTVEEPTAEPETAPVAESKPKEESAPAAEKPAPAVEEPTPEVTEEKAPEIEAKNRIQQEYEYNEDGSIKSQNFYDQNGNLNFRNVFDNGEAVYQEQYNSDGKIDLRLKLKDGYELPPLDGNTTAETSEETVATDKKGHEISSKTEYSDNYPDEALRGTVTDWHEPVIWDKPKSSQKSDIAAPEPSAAPSAEKPSVETAPADEAAPESAATQTSGQKPKTARQALDSGDYDTAIAQYQQLIQKNPKDAVAQNNLGVALQKKGDLEGAIENYKKALELDPDNAQVKTNLERAQKKLAISHNNQGLEASRAGNYQDAIESYKKALELAPDTQTVKENLEKTQRRLALSQNKDANRLFESGDISGAIACYQKALELAPDEPQIKKNLIQAYDDLAHTQYMNHDFQNALDNYSKILELDPDNTSAQIDRNYVRMGQVFKLRGSSETSEEGRTLAEDIARDLGNLVNTEGLSDADKARALYLQGFAYRATDDNNSALDCFRQSYRLDKNNHHALMEGANLYYNMGRYDMAEKCYIQAMNTGKLNEQDQSLAQKRVLHVADIHARRQAMQDEYRRMA